MTTPDTPVTTAFGGSVAIRLRLGFHVSKSSTVAAAVHSPYVHPSKGQAFQSKKGKVGAGCTTYDCDSGVATGEVPSCFVFDDPAGTVEYSSTGLVSVVHLV